MEFMVDLPLQELVAAVAGEVYDYLDRSSVLQSGYKARNSIRAHIGK